MRRRVGISCATLTCAGAAMVSAANCVSSQNSGPGGTDASSSYDTGSVNPPDTGVVQPSDSGTDAIVPVDSAPPVDAPSDAPLDAGCTPWGGFNPSPYVPAQQSSPSLGWPCAGLPIEGTYTAACLDDASTYSSCSGATASALDAGPQTGACLSCLFTPENSDAGYGPVIQGVVPVVNVAGCVQQADTTDAGYACASAIQSAWSCAEFACKQSCPVSDNPSRAAYLTCTHQAATGVCSGYTQAASACIAAELDSGASEVVLNCFDGLNDAGEALTVLDFFCGT
jgi:hypothetical protein